MLCIMTSHYVYVRSQVKVQAAGHVFAAVMHRDVLRVY